jgi:hypothetical protein
MKKFTLLTAVLFFAFLSHAQITKGSTMIGGSVSGGSNEQDDDQNQENKNSQWGVSVQFGRFIANNKAVGLFVNYGHGLSKFKTTGPFPYDTKDKNNSIGGGLFYRQYFPLSTKWYLFGDATLGYNKFVGERELNDKLTDKTKRWGAGLFITPGVSFAAGRRLFIESSFSNLLGLSYYQETSKEYSTTGTVINTLKTKSFGAQANTSGFNNIQFGLRWIIPGKTK